MRVDMWLAMFLASTALLGVAAGCARTCSGAAQADPVVEELMGRLATGDDTALDDLVALGSRAFEPLACEYRCPRSERARHRAIIALSRLPDTRVILLFADPPPIPEGVTMGGGQLCIPDLYVCKTTGLRLSELYPERVKAWYLEHEHELVWDYRLGRFVIPQAGERPW